MKLTVFSYYSLIQLIKKIIESTPDLKVVSNMAAGVDNIVLDAYAPKSIAVGHTPDVLTEETADLTMVLILSIARRIFQANQDAKEGHWTT